MTLATRQDTFPAAAVRRRVLADQVEHWARERPDACAYTYVDHIDTPRGESGAGAGDDGRARTLTWSQTHDRVVALAEHLLTRAQPGDRVAVLAPQGLEYVVALLAAMRAGMVAVPLFSPRLPRHAERLEGALVDCTAVAALTTADTVPAVVDFVRRRALPPMDVIAVDEVIAGAVGHGGGGSGRARAWTPPTRQAGDTAYLQYSSGSTRRPTGARITHANVRANAEQLRGAFELGDSRWSVVSWLPLFHDMGLVSTVAMPLVSGNHAVFMDPLAFIMRPVRWLRLLSRQEDVFGAAPNFAYDLCVDRVTPQERRQLNLSGVRALLNGAEPVRAATVERFVRTFASCGLAPETHCPAYGLAEATLYVSADSCVRPPRLTAFDPAALAGGRAVRAAEGTQGARRLASCGTPHGQRVRVVDPESGAALAEGRVGEIWVQGPNVAAGYWNRDGEGDAAFAGEPAEADADVLSGRWLRTGDLGALHEGELYITGRVKDLIIVDGRNHYPQDVEETVFGAHPAIRTDRVVVVSVPDTDGGEAVVVIAEHHRDATDQDIADAVPAVRSAVGAAHDLGAADVVVIAPGTLSRTSSGKLARQACRQRYLAGEFARS